MGDLLVQLGIGYVAGHGLDLSIRSGFRTFQRAVEIARERRAGRDFDVPERTALAVWQAAQGIDDEVLSEYLGGILAASDGNDDGAAMARVIEQLSPLDLRVHYVLYREFRRLRVPGHGDALQDHVFIPEVDLYSAIGLLNEPTAYRRTRNSLANLGRMGLIAPAMRQIFVENPSGSGLYATIDPPADPFVFGHIDPERWIGIDVSGSVVIYLPSDAGATLFAWGTGIPDPSSEAYLANAWDAEPIDGIEPWPGRSSGVRTA